MGRSKKPSAKGLKATESKTAVPKPSVEALVEKTQQLLGELNFELARKFAERILEQEPNHYEGRHMLGIIELEDGKASKSRKIFASLVPPSPTAQDPPPHSAYLYLAQLTDDDPRKCLSYYQSAVDLLILLIKGKERIAPEMASASTSRLSSEGLPELRETLISALVGMVEIWMSSDLCMEPEAESTCERLAVLAVQTDSDSVEALDCLASVRLSQSRADEAREVASKAVSALTNLQPDDARYPPLPVILNLCRRLLELSMFESALNLLQVVLATDDENTDAWYLQGWAFYLMAEQAREQKAEFKGLTWQELAQDARDCLDTCQRTYTQTEHEDPQLLEHVKELIAALEAAGITVSPEGEGDSVPDDAVAGHGEPAEEENWTDEEASDVEMG